jgi:hypothetical protein
MSYRRPATFIHDLAKRFNAILYKFKSQKQIISSRTVCIIFTHPLAFASYVASLWSEKKTERNSFVLANFTKNY